MGGRDEIPWGWGGKREAKGPGWRHRRAAFSGRPSVQILEPGAQSKVLKACDFFHRGCWREGGQRCTRTAWKSRPHGRERYLLPLGPKGTAGAPAPARAVGGERGVGAFERNPTPV